MSATKRGKRKQLAGVSEEEDFETFVRESLGQLSKGQKQIIQDISNLKAMVKLNETALDKISSQFKTLNDCFEELKGELHDTRCKVDEVESSVQKYAKQIEGMRGRLLSLERYSREYNLRFHNFPESTDVDCVQNVRSILSNQLDMEPEIGNAHRVGPRTTGTTGTTVTTGLTWITGTIVTTVTTGTIVTRVTTGKTVTKV